MENNESAALAKEPMMKKIVTAPKEKIFFQESLLNRGDVEKENEAYIINVYDDVQYQKILGFGGAFTESSAYNYAQLNDGQKQDFLEKYFSREKGIGYNFGRIPINSSDFSLDIYNYVNDGDETLDSFSLDRDRKYLIPFLKDALQYCQQQIVLFASPWSPPGYMKDNGSPVGGGTLKEEYKSLWAQYYVRYIQEMEKEGITVSAISVQNEPKAAQTWESCTYTPEQERDFIEKYLAPALDEAGLSHIRIIIWDHNKERVYDRSKKIFESPVVRDRVWAVGHHWYVGDHYEALRLVHEQFGKVLISTENSCPIDTPDITAAEKYALELCGDFGNFSAAFCDWNLLLDHYGGPYHNRSDKATSTALEDKTQGCYAPVFWDAEQQKLIYTPTYYYIGHFSKFVQRGAVRIATTKYTANIQVCGFRNPDGSIVLVMVNPTDEALPAIIRHKDVCTSANLAPHSIMTAFI